ncbi:MAG: AsmA family protein, partial [gamma proteobacterium symbiont of Phacoides pectinatus]
MKNNKWILGAAGLLVALLAGVVIFLKSIDFNEYKPLISEQVREATGRDLVIGGDISLELGLHTRLAVEQVTLSNARWGSEPVMVRLQRIEAEVALLPLLGGDVQIGRLVLMRPEILLERGADGMGNWEFRGAGAEADADAGGSESDGALPAIHRVLIEEARLTYREGADSEARQLEIKRFEASAESLSDPLALRVEGELDGQPVGLDQVCRYLVKDLGTSQSPKSTRQRDSRYCPDRPALITTPSRT